MTLTAVCNHRSSRVEYSDVHFDNKMTTRQHCLSVENVAGLYELQKPSTLLYPLYDKAANHNNARNPGNSTENRAMRNLSLYAVTTDLWISPPLAT